MNIEKRYTIWMPTLVSQHLAPEDHCCECCSPEKANVMIDEEYLLLCFYRRYFKFVKNSEPQKINAVPCVPVWLNPERKMTPYQIDNFKDEVLNLRICLSCLKKVNNFFEVSLLSDDWIIKRKLGFTMDKDVARHHKALGCKCCENKISKGKIFWKKDRHRVVCNSCKEILQKVIGQFF